MKNAEWKCLLYCIATSYAHQWKDLWARWSLASALTLSASHFQAPWKLATYNLAVLRSYPEFNNAILMQHLYIAFYINISNYRLQYSCINMCTFGLCSSVHVFLQLDNCTFKKMYVYKDWLIVACRECSADKATYMDHCKRPNFSFLVPTFITLQAPEIPPQRIRWPILHKNGVCFEPLSSHSGKF